MTTKKTETADGVPGVSRIAAALVKAQAEIGNAKKTSRNPHFKSDYADLTEVLGACKAALNKQDIAVVQMPTSDGPVVTVTTVLLHSSGESLQSALSLTATQNTPQAIGSAITYGRRYGIAAMVGVGVELNPEIAPEDDDGNAASAAAPPAAAALAKPTGFDGWWATMPEAAKAGTVALRSAFIAGNALQRGYALTALRDSLDDLKGVAAEADAAVSA